MSGKSKTWQAEYRNDATGEVTIKTISSMSPIDWEMACDIAENNAASIDPEADFSITVSPK